MTAVSASPATIRAVADAMQLAALLDDRAPKPTAERIAAWAERAEWHRLTECDLLDGVQVFYDQPHDRAIGIGDLIHHARYARQNRLDKEPEQDRQQRRDIHDVKAADELHAITGAAFTGPTPNRTKLLAAADTALQCCVDKTTAIEAIRGYLAAKREARKAADRKPKRRRKAS